MKKASISLVLLTILLIVQCSAYGQIIGGIGAQLFLDTSNGYSMPRIQSLVANTPADQKLHATDYIIKVNDTDCKNKSIQQVVDMIRGEAGTTVKVTVADTKDGKNARDYDLERVLIQTGAGADPLTTFYAACDNDVKEMRRKGAKIVKTYTSECGDYFFNFNADAAGTYHVRLMTMEEKTKDYTTHGFTPSARIFDGEHESEAITLTNATQKDIGTMALQSLQGDLNFSKPSVGVINTRIQNDVKKCKGMYIVVYQ